jgi:hypothetical protein
MIRKKPEVRRGPSLSVWRRCAALIRKLKVSARALVYKMILAIEVNDAHFRTVETHTGPGNFTSHIWTRRLMRKFMSRAKFKTVSSRRIGFKNPQARNTEFIAHKTIQ